MIGMNMLGWPAVRGSPYNRLMFPEYWTRAATDLSRQDAVMAELVERYAGVSLASRGDAFGTLARSIVGQQISVKAAETVWSRFAAQAGTVTPGRVIELGHSGLAGCGLSQRKIEYLSDLAGHFASGHLDPSVWAQSDDHEIIAELTAVRGIGRWTAEMFLIFHELRPDVFPLDDIGLQRAVSERYFSGERQSRRALAEFGERWRPWRSVATWYLWRSLDPIPVEY
jgi:DNA-3-methyladenine glycosylase II